MALDRAAYLEHFRRATARVVTLHPEESVGPIVQGVVDYVTSGTFGTQAERQEAAYIIANLLWTNLLGNAYNGHQMKHWLWAHGVTIDVDIPQMSEPAI